MIPYIYTQMGASVKSTVYWGYATTAITVANALSAMEVAPIGGITGEALVVSPSNTIALDWLTHFDTLGTPYYDWILIPDLIPNFPNYNKYAPIVNPTLIRDITNAFVITTGNNINGVPYRFYIYDALKLSMNLNFIYQ